MKQLLTISLALSMTLGCVMIDPFTKSNEAMMARLVQEMPMGDMLEKFFAAASGKKLIFVNMEDNQYTDDQVPEYMFLDAMYSRLTASKVKVHVLERDPDTLTMLEQEMDGVTLPATERACGKNTPCESEAGTAEEIEASKAAVASLLRELVGELSSQDVLVTSNEACCGSKGSSSKVTTELIANEVGATKAKLLQDLVTRYTDLHDTGSKAETFRREVDIEQADYLFAYRIYDYGTWSFKDKRITYIKIHYRIIGIDTGRVLLSDFIEHRIDDELSAQERRTLVLTYAKQSDFKRPAGRTAKDDKRD